MFQINWRLKSLIYWFLYFIFFKKILFFIQKKITKRAYSSLGVMFYAYKLHYNSLKKYKSKKILEFGAGKSLEQNIYLTFKFNNRINQTVIDIDKMIDFNLLNFAKNQLQKKIKLSFKTKNIRNLEDLKNILNIKYYAPINIIDLNEKEKFLEDAVKNKYILFFIVCSHINALLPEGREWAFQMRKGVKDFLQINNADWKTRIIWYC